MKVLSYIGFFIVFISLLMAFQIVDTSGAFERPPFRRHYMDKMKTFHDSQKRKCQEDAMVFARLQVDSVLTGKKLLVENDLFILLPKPTKPTKPNFDFEVDSMPVDPLFNRQDSGQ